MYSVYLLVIFVLFMMIDLFNVFSPFYLCIYFYYYNIQLWSLNPVLVLDEEQEEGFFLISLTRWKTALGRKIEKAKDACNQILVKSLAFYIIRRHQIKDKFSDSCLVFWGQDIALSSGEILITKLLVKE